MENSSHNMLHDDTEEPIVSIIMPCYNQGQYLCEALDSVINMTYKNWECIIVDDGSSDDTSEISKLYIKKDSRIRYMFQNNQGVCSAKNNGIRNSNGKYILPLDSDDIIERDFLKKSVTITEKDEGCRLVYGNVRYFGEKKGLHKHNYMSFNSLLHLNCFCNTSLYRRRDYDKTEGYHLNMTKGWEDWDFWISLLKPIRTYAGAVRKVHGIAIYYRIKPNTGNRIGADGRQLLRNLWGNHPDCYEEEIYRTWHEYDDLLGSRAYKIFLFLQKMKRRLF